MDGPKAAIRRSDSSMMAVGTGTPHSMSGMGQGGGGGVGVSSGHTGGSVPPQHPQSISGTGPTGPAGRERSAPTPTQSQGRGGGGGMTDDPPGILRDRGMTARKWNTDIPNILPHERVFPIQIGSELFRLSGASISSDAPSYFSQFFKCQLAQAAESDDAENPTVRTLYIDRDPVTFADISRHLQGYHVQPKNGSHFVKLFADAQFYSLPRLISQLYEESIFISIGHRDFQIPRELFSDPGNSPNYFSLGFAVFFSTPTEVFPGLSREGLLRPPSIVPPSVPNRSADTFAEILHLLRGYPLHIKNEEHRAELLRDCRYFHLKGLEQKLIRHHISYNLARQKQEICLRLEDVRQSGISIGPPNFPTPAQMMSRSSGGSSSSGSSTPPFSGYINYARPFVDTQPYELVLEIGDECTRLHFTPSGPSPTTNSNLNLLKDVRAEFFGEGKKRISRLFEVVATKMGLGGTSQPLGLLMKNGKGGAGSQPASPGNTLLSEDQVKVYLEGETCVVLDGKERSTTTRTKRQQRQYVEISDDDDDDDDDENEEGTSDGRSSARSPPRKRRRGEGGDEFISSGGSGLRGGSDSGPHSGPGWNTEERERESWIIKTGQWRLRVQHKSGASKGPVECVLVAVKLDAWRSELGRNSKRVFLGG